MNIHGHSALAPSNTHGHLPAVHTNRASHAKQTAVAGSALALDTGFFRYVASGTTSEARWKFGANRWSFKGGMDKRTLCSFI